MEDFSIANTAQFFTVLSKTLYTNDKLAVVREIICNAWDAHIAADRQDISIEINITDDELVIKDNGFGIPHADMHRRYFVYGLSDKLEDLTQTGGFGLGSKAPFAYSDHFTVISCHEGTKTIYNLSKASGEKGGKPKPRIIAQLPTEETGLTVRVPIQDKHDIRTFTEYARAIVSMGEINATLNGVKLDTYPISTALKGIYFFNPPSYFKENSFFIRVGTVVYPIEEHDLYSVEYQFLRNLFKDILGKYQHMAMLLQGPPGKISVAPNRESLSMSKTTQETIKNLLMDVILFTDFNRNQGIKKTIIKYIDNAFAELASNNNKKKLVNLTQTNPKYFLQSSLNSQVLSNGDTFEQVVYLFVQNPNPKIVAFVQAQFWPRFVKAIDKKYSSWFPKDIWKHEHRSYIKVNEFARSLQKATFRAGLDPRKLVKLDTNSTGDKRMKTLSEGLRSETLTDYQEIVKHKVVLCPTRQAAVRYHRVHPYEHNVLAYITDRSKEVIDKAMKFFTDLGFETSDFTKDYNDHYSTANTVRVKKPKVDARLLPLMSNLLSKGGRVNRRGHVDHPTIVTGVDYPAICLLNDIGRKNNFPSAVVDWLGWGDSTELIAEFGDKVGIAPTIVKYNIMIEAGKIPIEQYVGEMICKKVHAIPSYLDKLAFMKLGKNDTYQHENEKAKRFLKIMSFLPQQIIENIPSAEHITAEEHKWLVLYIQMLDRWSAVGEFKGKLGYDQFLKDREFYVNIKSTPSVDMVKEMLKNPMLRYLNMEAIMSDLPNLDRKNHETLRRQIFLETTLLLALTD